MKFILRNAAGSKMPSEGNYIPIGVSKCYCPFCFSLIQFRLVIYWAKSTTNTCNGVGFEVDIEATAMFTVFAMKIDL